MTSFANSAINVFQTQKREESSAERKQLPTATLKFVADDDDSQLVVKTLRNNSAVKLRGRSLSAGGQKGRLNRASTQRRRRLLSHGRAVQIVRLKRALSLPAAMSATHSAADSSCAELTETASDKSGSNTPLKVRAGVFERTWTDSVADNAVVSAPAPVERCQTASVAEAGVDLVIDDAVNTSVSTNRAAAATAEHVSNESDLTLCVSDEPVSYIVYLQYTSGAYRSWRVIEIKIQFFQAWKVMESGLGHGKLWKINQMVANFWTHCTRFWPLYALS